MTKIAVQKYSPVQPKYDPTLDAYTDVVLFPKKMELAKATFEKYGLPAHIKRAKKTKQPHLSTLQAELLTVYAIEPTETQMQQLKDFLHQLFGEEVHKI